MHSFQFRIQPFQNKRSPNLQQLAKPIHTKPNQRKPSNFNQSNIILVTSQNKSFRNTVNHQDNQSHIKKNQEPHMKSQKYTNLKLEINDQEIQFTNQKILSSMTRNQDLRANQGQNKYTINNKFPKKKFTQQNKHVEQLNKGIRVKKSNQTDVNQQLKQSNSSQNLKIPKYIIDQVLYNNLLPLSTNSARLAPQNTVLSPRTKLIAFLNLKNKLNKAKENCQQTNQNTWTQRIHLRAQSAKKTGKRLLYKQKKVNLVLESQSIPMSPRGRQFNNIFSQNYEVNSLQQAFTNKFIQLNLTSSLLDKRTQGFNLFHEIKSSQSTRNSKNQQEILDSYYQQSNYPLLQRIKESLRQKVLNIDNPSQLSDFNGDQKYNQDDQFQRNIDQSTQVEEQQIFSENKSLESKKQIQKQIVSREYKYGNNPVASNNQKTA